jgi:hypothetical protein
LNVSSDSEKSIALVQELAPTTYTPFSAGIVCFHTKILLFIDVVTPSTVVGGVAKVILLVVANKHGSL